MVKEESKDTKETSKHTDHSSSKKHEHHAKASKKDALTAKESQNMWKIFTFILLGVIVVYLLLQNINVPLADNVQDDYTYEAGEAPSLGDANAPVTMIEFSDFECPFCARFHSDAYQDIKKNYVDTGKVRLVFKQFPLSFHPNAQKAGEASLCAHEQEMFWAYHDMLFENQQALSVASLKKYAADLGLDTAEFNECLDSGKMAAQVQADMQEGVSLGVDGTPGFVINGQAVSGALPYAQFVQILDAALAGEDMPNTQAAGANDQQLADTSNDPDIELTIVVDETCATCDTTNVLSAVQGELFPTTTVREVALDSAEGQALVTEYELDAVPSYIFTANVAQAANYDISKQAFKEVNGMQVLLNEAVGPGKFITPPDAGGNAVKGDPNAPVTIIEFSDFECPYCEQFYSQTLPQIQEQYIDTGKVKFVYRDLPLSFHPNAQKAAEAAECAGEQGKYFDMHDILFENQQALSTANYKQWAGDLGLDQASFDTCLDSGQMAAEVQADMAVAAQYGISGTPGFVVNGIVLAGALPFQNFKEVIDAELAAME